MLHLNLFRIAQNNNMMNYNFWKKTSTYSTVICGLLLIVLMFFKKYVETFIFPFLTIGVIVLLISIIAELMKFILRRKGNE